MKLTEAEIAALGPWDASDPFEAMAESFKRQVTMMLAEAFDAAIFRDLTPEQQLQAFVAGVTTGLFGACFIYVSKDQRDEMAECIATYLPQARTHAEVMVDQSESARLLKDGTE